MLIASANMSYVCFAQRTGWLPRALGDHPGKPNPHRYIDPEREIDLGAPYAIHSAVFLGKVL